MLAAAMDAAPPVDLVWTQAAGGEDCISPSDLASKVAAALGHPVFSPASSPDDGHVRGSVGPGPFGRGWLAVVEARHGAAPPLRRELAMNAPDCRQLDEAIVLVVALLLDSAVTSLPPLTIGSSAPSISASLGPDVAVAWGMLPGPSIGVGLVSTTQIGRLLPIVLSFHEWPSTHAAQGTAGGRIAALTFGAAVCPLEFRRRGWEIFGCAGASGGEVTSAGSGLVHTRNDARQYIQIDTQVGLRLRVADHVASRVALGAGFPFTRYEYQFDAADQVVDVFRTWSVVPFGQVAIEVRTSR